MILVPRGTFGSAFKLSPLQVNALDGAELHGLWSRAGEGGDLVLNVFAASASPRADCTGNRYEWWKMVEIRERKWANGSTSGIYFCTTLG